MLLHKIVGCSLTLGMTLSGASAAPARMLLDLNETPFHGGTIVASVDGGDGTYFFLAYQHEPTWSARTPLVIGNGQLWVTDGTAAGTLLLKERLVYAYNLVVAGRRAFFSASDGYHGREPWVSDGTPEGTLMVRDLVPGVGDSRPASPVELGGLFYFTADGPTGRVLWRTDGTEDGTVLADVVPSSYSGPAQVAELGKALDALFGWFDDGVHGSEPWRTDGTPEGTWMLADVRPGRSSSRGGFAKFVELDGSVLFVANDGTGWALWSSDGTDQGVVRLGEATFDSNPTRVGHLVFYVGVGGLWRSDGTPEGTFSLGDLGSPGAGPHGFVGIGDTAYFIAGNGLWRELWRTDGTAAGTKLIDPFWYPVHDEQLQVLDGRLLFRAWGTESGRELWAGDGTNNAIVADLNPGIPSGIDDSGYFALFRVVGDKLWFEADDGIHGPELWLSDGTESGTTLLADLNPFVGTQSSSPSNFIDVSGKPFFTAGPADLWRTDGTTEGTRPVVEGSYVNCCLVAGNQELFFHTAYPDHFGAAWRSDGTAEGTFPLDLGVGYFFPSTSLGERTLLHRSYGPYRELWSTDGTVAGSVYLGDGDPSDIGRLGSVGIFGFDGPDGRELWRTDATPEGTFMIRDIEAGPASSSPFYFVALGQKMFFFVEKGYIFELWTTDGTPEGTQLARRITGLHPRNLTAADALVFFTNQLQGTTLWASDGTESGTTLLRSFDADIDQLTPVGSRLFFRVARAFDRVELWMSDGTRDGTVQVIEATPRSMAANHLFGVHDRLLFSASVGDPSFPGPRQLWRSDGTELGTRPVLDVDPHGFVRVGARLYFGADDGIHGDEPWIGYAAILAGQPLAALRDLQGEVERLQAPRELTRGLEVKLDEAVRAFESGDPEAAKRALRTAIRQLGATWRRAVDRSAAEELLAFAREVLDLLDSE